MNKEYKVMVSLATLAAILLLIALTGLIFSIKLLIWLFIPSVILGASLAVMSLYFRVQHNIDRKFMKSIAEIKLIKTNFSNSLASAEDRLNNNISKTGNQMIGQLALLDSEADNKIKRNINEINNKLSKNLNEVNNKLSKNLAEMNNKFSTALNYQSRKVSQILQTYIKDKRRESLIKNIPKIFDYKNVLYIGARKDRYDFLEDFQRKGYKIDVLEIFKPNAEYLKTLPWISEVIEGDVTKFKTKKKYDVVFWWHGPEHIEENKVKQTLKSLELITKKIIVLGCPWGTVAQEPSIEEENPYEKHISYFDDGYFESLGYKTEYSGVKNLMGSNILSFKTKNK